MPSGTNIMPKLTTPKHSNSLQSQFLLSMPQLLDPNFRGTLSYVCEHDEFGAMAVTINRPSEIMLYELLEQLGIPVTAENFQDNKQNDEQIIYIGGPVQQDRGFILHTDQRDWQSTLEINEHVRLTTSKDILEAIAKGDGPEHYLITLGYAGWSEGQLEEELLANAWLNCPADDEILFHTKGLDKLNKTMQKLGINSSQLNGQVGHA
jgi:putative transcriptional regulator